MRDNQQCCPLIQIALLNIRRTVGRTIFETASRIITNALCLINPRRIQLPILFVEAAFKTISLIISLSVRACPIWDHYYRTTNDVRGVPNQANHLSFLPAPLTDLRLIWIKTYSTVVCHRLNFAYFSLLIFQSHKFVENEVKLLALEIEKYRELSLSARIL